MEDLVDRTIEPRLNQIFVPLLSLAGDPQVRAELRELAQRYNRELVVERGMDAEAYILEILRDLLAGTDDAAVSVRGSYEKVTVIRRATAEEGKR